MHRLATAKVHLDRIKKNILNIKAYTKAKSVCVMVKANAYGHGAEAVAKAVESIGVDSLGVISVEEAILLRDSGVKAPIWMFANLWEKTPESLDKYSVIPMIGSLCSLENYLSYNSKLPFHIKINSGMNRFGFKLEDLSELKSLLSKFSVTQIDGVCSHLYRGEDYDQPNGDSKRQKAYTLEFIEKLDLPFKHLHFHKSASSLRLDPAEEPEQFIRLGIASYGIRPEKSFEISDLNLLPAMELCSVISGIQSIKKGEGVSYSSTFVAQRDSLIGVVQLGYADGLHRRLSNLAKFLVHGQFVKQIGNICMDYCMVDLTDLNKKVELGDEVVIFGQQDDKINSVEELAQLAGTIPYELLTSIGSRVQRKYIDGESQSEQQLS
ncbi:MAG: alanine racemase [Bdellovibrionales bacterium]